MRALLKLCFAALLALVACVQLTEGKGTASIDAKLNPIGNTAMQVVLTNNGILDLNLLNKGTILGDAACQKVMVYSNNTAVSFEGVRFGLPLRGNLGEDSFTHVPVGRTVTVVFDAAEQYNLSHGGTFTAVAAGAIPYAEGSSTVLTGSTLSYKSNVIEIEVDGNEAGVVKTASSRLSAIAKALDIKDSCEGELLEKLEEATNGDGGCVDQAVAANEDVKSQSTTDLFKLIFRNDNDFTKEQVSGRLVAMVEECEEIEPGPIKFYCEDIWGFCYDLEVEWAAAYTDDKLNQICLCEKAYDLPAVTQKCHDNDLAGVIVHELAHLSSIWKPAARDYVIGWQAVTDPTKLTPDEALNNADSYRIYAQAAYLSCPLETEVPTSAAAPI